MKSKTAGSVSLAANAERAVQTVAIEASHSGSTMIHLHPHWSDASETGAAIVLRISPHGGREQVIPITPTNAPDAPFGYFLVPTTPPRADIELIVERTGGKQAFQLDWDLEAEISEKGVDTPPPGAFVRAAPVPAGAP